MGDKFTFRIPIILLWLLSYSPATADDGWYRDFGAVYGQSYSKVSHPEIQLKEEALYFIPENDRMRKLSVLALMRFYNHSKKDLDIEAAFPIEFEAEVASSTGATVLKSLGILEKIGDCDKDGCGELVYSSKAKSLKQQVFSIEKFQKLDLEKLTDQGIAIPELIFQGRQVKHTQVVINADFDESHKSGKVKFSFHFAHRLKFPRQSPALLSIQYSTNFQLSSGGQGDRYFFDYILKTAATWKPIFENLYVFTSSNLDIHQSAEFHRSGRFAGLSVFTKHKVDAKLLSRITIGNDPLSQASPMEREGALDVVTATPALWEGKFGAGYSKIPKTVIKVPSSIVTVLSESMALRGMNEFVRFEPLKRRQFEEKEGFIMDQLFGFKAPFSGQSLVDHFKESAWCYTPTTASLAKVSFNLSSKIASVGFLNGYQKPKDPLRIDEKGQSLFELNGRIKILGFYTLKGREVGRITLSDSRAFQAFPLSLKNGTYEMRVLNTYPGKTSKDVCLSEVEFLPDLPGLADFVLKGETFLSKSKFSRW